MSLSLLVLAIPLSHARFLRNRDEPVPVCDLYCQDKTGNGLSYCMDWYAEPSCYLGDNLSCYPQECSGGEAPSTGPTAAITSAPAGQGQPYPAALKKKCDGYCVGGMAGSYCQDWYPEPTCYLDDARTCNPNDCAGYTAPTTVTPPTTPVPATTGATPPLTTTPTPSPASSTPSGHKWTDAVIAQCDAYCGAKTAGSYCQYWYPDSTCIYDSHIPCTPSRCASGTYETTTPVPEDPVFPIDPEEDFPTSSLCSENRLGLYTWNQAFWNVPESDLVQYLRTEAGAEYGCGDVYVSLADWSNWNNIENLDRIVPFVKAVREAGWTTGTIYFTYGDVDMGEEEGTIGFVDTIFDQVLDSLFTVETAALYGPLGVSYDVEHGRPENVKVTLIAAQLRKRASPVWGGFPQKLKIQWLIQGREDAEGTLHIMRYADSALAMNYRNTYEKVPELGLVNDNIVDRMMWMLTAQMPGALGADSSVRDTFRAKIQVMVEADCQLGNHCKKTSFCTFADRGPQYVYEVLDKMSVDVRGQIGDEVFDKLFDLKSRFVVHNFDWFRCFVPTVRDMFSRCALLDGKQQECILKA